MERGTKFPSAAVYPKKPVSTVAIAYGDKVVLGYYAVASDQYDILQRVLLRARERRMEPWVNVFYGVWPILGTVDWTHRGVVVPVTAMIEVQSIITFDDYRKVVEEKIKQLR